MKTFLSSLILLFSFCAIANSNGDVTCKSLKKDARLNCEQNICDYMIEVGKECIPDVDFFDGVWYCSGEEFKTLLDEHNKSEPNKKLICDE